MQLSGVFSHFSQLFIVQLGYKTKSNNQTIFNESKDRHLDYNTIERYLLILAIYTFITSKMPPNLEDIAIPGWIDEMEMANH